MRSPRETSNASSWIASIIHKPVLAILDEPFTVSIRSAEFFLGLVRELRADGTTIILCAHQMDLVERIADRVLLMNRGREILSGSVDELHGRLDARPHIRLTFEDGVSSDPLKEDPDVDELTEDQKQQECTCAARDGSSVSRFLARAVTKVAIRSISTEPPRLHDVFVRAVRDDDSRSGSDRYESLAAGAAGRRLESGATSSGRTSSSGS